MRVCRICKATLEIDALHGKYRHVWDEIAKFERLLAANQNHGHQRVPGLRLVREGEPASIWKARVLHPQLGGKSSGLRYVYERLWIENGEHAVALTIYVHQAGAKESELIEHILALAKHSYLLPFRSAVRDAVLTLDPATERGLHVIAPFWRQRRSPNPLTLGLVPIVRGQVMAGAMARWQNRVRRAEATYG